MSKQYHLNGKLVSPDDAVIPVRDRGFMYGDAVFETMRGYGGEVFKLDAHLDRLERSCSMLSLNHGIDRSELISRVNETIEANPFTDAYVKLSISRGEQPGKLTPKETVDPTVAIVIAELPCGGIDGEPVWDTPATTEIVTTRGVPDNAIPSGAKTHNYLNQILARIELSETADEALLLDQSERLLEGATSNCFFVQDKTLHTPTDSLSLLPGITRKVVIELANKHEIPVKTGSYGTDALKTADEVFLTNSTWEVRPVTQIDDTEFSIGPITEALQTAYSEMIQSAYY